MTEVEVFRFPNQLCTDKGRAINQQEPGWENTLTGSPKEIYHLWDKYLRPRGYKLKVQIVDFPDGMPGDIGMTLSWGTIDHTNGDSNEQQSNPCNEGTVVIRHVRNVRLGDGLHDRRSPAHDVVLGRDAPARQSIPRTMAETVPHVLSYEAELVIDGRTLQRPVNYGLVRIVPPQGVTIDPHRRPLRESSIRVRAMVLALAGSRPTAKLGVALKAGHPCYFVGFLPEPMPGQTIEDIARAEAIFLEKVIALHPDADGKPCVIGNCQGGWAVMMLAALCPELFGPIIIAGSPLSYWAGVHGKNPMRYSGGLLGGSWLTALTSDLGGGKFDGAWLVQNFENQNPGKHAVDQAVQRLFQDRHRGAALSRFRALLGRPRQP